MPRNPSELTEAIRSLLDETNGSITHAEVRPRLVEMGFDIAVEQDRMSSQLSAVNEYEYDVQALKDALRDNDMKLVRQILDPVFKATGLDESTQQAVIDEMIVRIEYAAERNHFDVTKFNWRQTANSAKPSVSRKPESTKNSRARAVTKKSSSPPPKHRRRTSDIVVTEPKRRGRPRKVVAVQPSMDELAALEIIEKLGGVSHAETRIEELRAEANRLENAIELLAQLTKRSEELQKRLASAA